MNTYKKTTTVPSLKLDKTKLFDIEKELRKPWDELYASLIEKINEKVKKHNSEIKGKKYSFVFGTDDTVSKSKISKRQQEELITNVDLINKELSYPQRTPSITYRNKGKQIVVTSVNELYEHTLNSQFKELEFVVYGPNSKVITLTLTSYVGVLNSFGSGNTLTVSSNDEAWTNLASERILAILKRFESPGEVFNNWFVKIFFYLILPMSTVYVVSLLLQYLFNYMQLVGDFKFFLSVLIHFFVFVFSIFRIYDELFESLVGGAVLSDQVSNKTKFWLATGWALVLGVISTILWETINSIL